MPPVRSPVTLRSVLRAGRSAARKPGDALERARELIASRFDADHVELLGSGTQALQSAVTNALARTGSDALVGAPAFTCFDVASALVGADARVVLYDVDPATLSPSLESLEHACRLGARTIVLAPLYGYPPDYDGVRRIAHQYEAVIIEDIAQGHGAAWRRRSLGFEGDYVTLSFGRGKGWTGGSGGALLARNPPGVVADRGGATGSAHILIAAAVTALLSDPLVYGMPRSLPFLQLGRTIYHAPVVPAGMSAAAAALLRETATASDAEAGIRGRNAAEYMRLLARAGLAHVVPSLVSEAEGGWLRFPVLLPDAARAAATRTAVRLGIAPSYPKPLTRLPQLVPQLAAHVECPGADRLATDLVTLPAHSRTDDLTRKAAVDWVRARAGATSHTPVAV